MPRAKTQRSLTLIAHCQRILADIQPATVRAVCYWLFVAGHLPSMSRKHIRSVYDQLKDAREQGMIPWGWIVDETREPERAPTWRDLDQFIRVVQRSYRRDYWTMQPHRIEVWSEKGTVRGTLAPVLDRYGVTFRVMHGFGSATAVHDVAMETQANPQPLIFFYVGDRDVEEAIKGSIVQELWDRCELIEQAECNSLKEVLGNWKQAISGRGTRNSIANPDHARKSTIPDYAMVTGGDTDAQRAQHMLHQAGGRALR